ncbi:MAG: hypothetical protein KGY54_01655 [Oleiphilaceae bacterium]|nr:hypothetical protein [Oleiphilaceae bacterium]
MPLSVSAETWSFVGKAESLEGKPLYEEHHEVSGECRDGLWQPESHEVRYLKPGTDEQFANKTLDYSESVLRPSFELRQPEFDEKMVVENSNDKRLTIDWQTNDGQTKEFSLSLNDEVAVDAGFDNLTRENWQAVVSDTAVSFQFLAPTRGEHYGFVLEPAQDNRIESEIVRRIGPTGMVMRFLVDPILLGYDRRGALKQYLGLTNLRQDADSNYTANIRYEHDRMPGCDLVQ